jgi:hypothetical protein
MRLTEERIAVLAREICDALLDAEHVDLEITEERFRFLVESLLIEDFRLEDQIEEEATVWLRTHRPSVREGTPEWEVQMDKVREDLAIAKGYVIR